MLKICFVVRGLTQGGVKRFLENILQEINKNVTSEFDIYMIHNEPDFIKRYNNIIDFYIESKNKFVFDYYKSYLFLRKYEFDVLVYPKNIIPLVHFLTKGKKINIVHDLGYFEKKIKAYPFLDTLFMKTFMAATCKLSDKVLAVSDFTKNDITSRLSIDPGKVVPIYEGVEGSFKVKEDQITVKATLEKYKIKKPFIFYSGSVSPRKNLLRVLKAFYLIRNEITQDLIITGNKVWGETEFEKFAFNYLRDRVKILGHVGDNELVDLYNSADLYVYPSLYEGFGLPILEAQKCGCPVLTSNVTSCPEVAGEGAHVVNPYSEVEIAEGMLKILMDDKYSLELIEKGFENVKRYSWHKSSVNMTEAIKSCV